MSSKKPKWFIKDIDTIKEASHYEKNRDRFALIKKVNKMKISELIESIVYKKINVLEYLYSSDKVLKSILTDIRSNIISTGRFEKFKNKYIEILIFISKNYPSFLKNLENVKSLSTIAEYQSEIIRPLDSWNFKNSAPERQLNSLLRHLYAKYDVPSFLDKGFVKGEMEMVELFLHIGSGKPLKSFPFIPKIKINNKVYHHLINSPIYVDYFQAFRRAQILSLGADEYICNALMASKIGNKDSESKDEFWITVINFFINQNMISSEKVSEIIDYIYNQKFERVRAFVNNIFVYQEPLNKGFTMKGRTAESLLRLSDNWHRFLSRDKSKNTSEKWEPAKISDVTYDLSDRKYSIIQLTNKTQLSNEGNQMHHCVSSYSNSCASGKCSIFSLRKISEVKYIKETDEKIIYPTDVRIATIEVRSSVISQVKGKFNQKIEGYYWRMIEEWATDQSLTISNYCY